MERSGDTFSSQNTSGYRLMIFRQLQQAVESMHRPEEMFQWLASLIVERFDVAIVQFWTCEGRLSNQPTAQLRAMASQDPSQPAYLFGDKVTMTVEQLVRGQQTIGALPVDRLFPRYLAMLLQRYGLSSSCFYVAEKSVRFPPSDYMLAQRETAALSLIALLFLRRPANQNLISTVGIILEQAIVLAETRRLLLPAGSGPLATPQEALIQEAPALPDLIPRRKQDANLMLSSNPFARTISIADKQAHRLYEAIDGHLNLNQLCGRTGMSLLEVRKALKELARLQCIEIYTPDGQPVDINTLFNSPR
jgi:hypothetical protein